MISLQWNRKPTRGCFGLLAFTAAAAFAGPAPDAIWKRHVIDDSSRGADGARLADVNGDGLLDIATGWEAGGIVRAYLNPGPAQSKQKWPAVTVGEVAEVEDAVFVDLDGDGAVDVVSSCESGISTMFVHWAPREKSRYLDASAWRTAPLPVTQNKTKWMFCEPMQVDGRHGVDLIAGSKGRRTGGEAMLGWLQAPPHPRDLAAWTWHPLRTAGWIMGIQSSDMDGDGDLDIVFTDRFNGRKSGCHWLENPGKAHVVDGAWKEHVIGVAGGNALFFCLTDLDGDGLEDVCVGTHGADEGGPETDLFFLRRLDRSGTRWAERRIPLPPESAQFKAVSAGDVDLDGKLDLVVTFARAKDKPALIWLSHDGSPFAGRWTAHPLSGVDGKKLDLVTLLDLDGDGDLDALTTEEGFNLGVIWYENPTKQP
jgi:hypothetical protein